MIYIYLYILYIIYAYYTLYIYIYIYIYILNEMFKYICKKLFIIFVIVFLLFPLLYWRRLA